MFNFFWPFYTASGRFYKNKQFSLDVLCIQYSYLNARALSVVENIFLPCNSANVYSQTNVEARVEGISIYFNCIDIRISIHCTLTKDE